MTDTKTDKNGTLTNIADVPAAEALAVSVALNERLHIVAYLRKQAESFDRYKGELNEDRAKLCRSLANGVELGEDRA